MSSLTFVHFFPLLTAFCFNIPVASAASPWIDPDTPRYAQLISPLSPGDERSYQLVFSDEFNVNGRVFHDGYDPRWTALSKNDVTNNPLHYYSSDTITTSGGVLNLTIDYDPKTFLNKNNVTETKNYRSGMLQSWNKFCFMGGIVEFSVKLPGNPRVGGLWPAIWMMGNLARATYINSTERIWPYSTNVCDNRTMFGQQEINSCSSDMGRGAPEIDILEIMYMEPWPHPVLSTSLQVAPGLEEQRPVSGFPPNASQVWYSGLEYGSDLKANLNTYFYGARFWGEDNHQYQTDAISANVLVNDSHFSKQHLYRVEWEPPNDRGEGYLRWYVNGKLVTGIRGESLRLSRTAIPKEPMYMLMNLAVSKDWGFPDAYFLNCKCKCYNCDDPCCRACALPKGFCENLPAFLEVDHVRVYQAIGDPNHVIGCSPSARPTEDFIQSHIERYVEAGQPNPLLNVVSGGGPCQNDEDCGGPHNGGTCSAHLNFTCDCTAAWTGPTCMAYSTRVPTTVSGKSVWNRGGFFGFCMLIVLGLVWRQCRPEITRESEYKKLPDETSIDASRGWPNHKYDVHLGSSYQRRSS